MKDMKVITAGRARYTVRPERGDAILVEIAKASKIPTPAQVQAWGRSRTDKRDYPQFVEGMSTAEYVKRYYRINADHFAYGASLSDISKFFEPLSTARQYTPIDEPVYQPEGETA